MEKRSRHKRLGAVSGRIADVELSVVYESDPLD